LTIGSVYGKEVLLRTSVCVLQEGVCSWSLSSPHENSSTPCTFANKFFYIPPLVSTSIITDFRLVCERKAYYFYMKGSGRPNDKKKSFLPKEKKD
jgi:hypothetical protein